MEKNKIESSKILLKKGVAPLVVIIVIVLIVLSVVISLNQARNNTSKSISKLGPALPTVTINYSPVEINQISDTFVKDMMTFDVNNPNSYMSDPVLSTIVDPSLLTSTKSKGMTAYENKYSLSTQITQTQVISNTTNNSVYTPLLVKVIAQIAYTQYNAGNSIGSGNETRVYDITLYHENTSWKVVGYKDVTTG